jgi:hypothetical protein
MKTIKYLKDDYLQLDNKIYKPYSICDLAETKFGEQDQDGYSHIAEWFNHKGYTYIFDKTIKNEK